jgi:hypothetical protein
LWGGCIVALAVGINPIACGEPKCRLGEQRCNAGNREVCQECADPGCAPDWHVDHCYNGICVVVSPGDVVCALSSKPDPRCVDKDDVCISDDVSLHCYRDFAISNRPCSAESTPEPSKCANAGTTTTCVPKTATRDPLCDDSVDSVTSVHHCDGNTSVTCNAGFATERTPCDECLPATGSCSTPGNDAGM